MSAVDPKSVPASSGSVLFQGMGVQDAGRILDGRTYDAMPPRVNKSDPIRKERMAMIDVIAMGAATV